VAQPAAAQEIVGKWRLVKAGGQLPAALNIKSLQIDIAADGTWVSDIEMQGQFAGMSMKGGGKWSLANGMVSYTSGANAGKSRAKLVSGRLILDPDFSIRKDGTTEVAGEYEPVASSQPPLSLREAVCAGDAPQVALAGRIKVGE
jgi:hypothetical protein